MKLKQKLLTCSSDFAEKYNLKKAGLSESCSNGQHCLMQPKARLSVILGMDIHHVRPKQIDEFSDKHGSMSLFACPLSSKLILCGKRVYPYTPAQHTNSFGVITGETAKLEEEEDMDRPKRTDTSFLGG